jgi:sugar lactone lactonase YvrE
MRRSFTFVRAILSVLVVLGLGTSPVMAAPPASPGDILVADQGGTIHHFSASGADLGAFASGLSSPSWITTDRHGNIYVSEYTGAKVNKFSPTGVILLTITTPYIPGGIRVDKDGAIYVADYAGGNVYRYSASGADLGVFASPPLARADFMAFDAVGNLYVTDFVLGVVRRISPTGVDLGNFVTGFPGPEGIAFDADGNLYISSFNLDFIEMYSASGADLGTFASISPSGAQPYGLAFDGAGNLYVANYAEGNIHKVSPSGDDLGVFASTGLVLPRDLVIIPSGGPATKDECKKDGWQSFEFPRAFKNQGDCIQFVNTAK